MKTDTISQATDETAPGAPPKGWDRVEALRIEWKRTSDARLSLTDREAAIQAEVDGHESELTQLYAVDPLRNDTGDLVGRIGTLNMGLEDVRRRLPAAHAAERHAQEACQAEQSQAQAADRRTRRDEIHVAAAENTAAIAAAIVVLQDLLDARFALAQEAGQLNDESRALQEGTVVQVGFDLADYPSLRRRTMRPPGMTVTV